MIRADTSFPLRNLIFRSFGIRMRKSYLKMVFFVSSLSVSVGNNLALGCDFLLRLPNCNEYFDPNAKSATEILNVCIQFCKNHDQISVKIFVHDGYDKRIHFFCCKTKKRSKTRHTFIHNLC